MPVIKAQKVPKKQFSSENLLSKFCYYFPQYKYHEAKKLPYKRVIIMLQTAQRERASKYYELTQIVAAPHTRKGSGVRALLDRYKKLLN